MKKKKRNDNTVEGQILIVLLRATIGRLTVKTRCRLSLGQKERGSVRESKNEVGDKESIWTE